MKIISKETIKPSSPTPPHLTTHILSLGDSHFPDVPVPFVFLYKSYNDGDINILKNSLSQCLTLYYPFAGRFIRPNMGAIDCNDEGVEFVEADHDRHLEDFIENHESLYELIPTSSSSGHTLLQVQLNRFTGGGVALGLSITHKMGEAVTAITFINQWAKIVRGESPIKPVFITSDKIYDNAKLYEVHSSSNRASEVKYVRRSFVFTNSKLNDLKKKIMSEGIDFAPTRVEALTSLIFKCMVDVATTKSGVFNPSTLGFVVDMRKRILKNDHEKVVGNIVLPVMIDSHENTLYELVSKMRKGKMEIGESDMQELGERLALHFRKYIGGDPTSRVYYCPSFCGFPVYEVDFGWGKPIQAKYVDPNTEESRFNLFDTPSRDGIEVVVNLPEEELMIFQQDKELLAYVGV